MGNYNNTISEEKLKYLRLLSEQYPTTASVYRAYKREDAK